MKMHLKLNIGLILLVLFAVTVLTTGRVGSGLGLNSTPMSTGTPSPINPGFTSPATPSNQPMETLAAANVYYVAKNGSDNGPGTLAQPWLTVQKAARTMMAGDTVDIEAGTYNEQVTPANSGSATSPITYQNYGMDAVILDGTAKSTGSTGLFNVENKSYITLKGIQIQNSDYAGVFVYGASDHITLQGLTIHDTAISGIAAVSTGWSTPCTVTNLALVLLR